MTGGEAAAAAMVGKVVTHAGKEIAEEGKSIRKELLEQAKETPEFGMAARSYAKRVAIRQEMLTVMYKPIAKMLGFANHYFENDFEKEMAEKLADVPEENLVAPKASLAAPAMQLLGFSLDEPDLKEMYLNLLATASDNRKHGSAHPSFVEIIKQLSSDELPVLNRILTAPGNYSPIVALKLVTAGEEGWVILQKHIIKLDDEVSGRPIIRENLAAYIDNWVRLGLVEVSYVNFITRANGYDWVEQRPEVMSCRAHFNPIEGKSIEIDNGSITPTAFGASFAKVVGVTG